MEKNTKESFGVYSSEMTGDKSTDASFWELPRNNEQEAKCYAEHLENTFQSNEGGEPGRIERYLLR